MSAVYISVGYCSGTWEGSLYRRIFGGEHRVGKAVGLYNFHFHVLCSSNDRERFKMVCNLDYCDTHPVTSALHHALTFCIVASSLLMDLFEL